MNAQQAYNIWAPPEADWSYWVKPVLFAYLHRGVLQPPGEQIFRPDTAHLPPARNTVLVIDLPGADAVTMAMAAARIGYRPIPLFNALPSPSGIAAACDVSPLLRSVLDATPALEALSIVRNAPPAFILDARRRHGSPTEGMFDNRSASLPTDFPSGNLLLSRGYTEAILIQPNQRQPQEDLAHTLLRWQLAGMKIKVFGATEGIPPAPIRIVRPFLFRMIWQRFLATIGLKRSPLGGFGGTLPIPSSGG